MLIQIYVCIVRFTTHRIWRNKYYGEDNDSDDNDFQSNVCWYCKLIWIKRRKKQENNTNCLGIDKNGMAQTKQNIFFFRICNGTLTKQKYP